MRLGVFGGTFDPIHNGHLRIAETARDSLNLDRVLFVPVGLPVHRQHAPYAAAEARYQMCRLAIAGREGFAVSRIETDSAAPCYTVLTLARIQTELPDADLRLIIGADEAVKFPEWREPRRILEQARLAVATRPGLDSAALYARLPQWVTERMDVLPPLEIAISATDIRSRLVAGQPVRDLIPDGVVSYIEQEHLYSL